MEANKYYPDNKGVKTYDFKTKKGFPWCFAL